MSFRSNILSQRKAVAVDPAGNLIFYMKLDSDVLDSVGTNNGTPTAITYAPGKVGNAAVFNGTSSFISVPDANNLTFTDGANDLPFSLSFPIKFNTKNTSYFFGKDGSATKREWLVSITGSGLTFYLFNADNSARISMYYPTANIPLDTWINVTITYSGNKLDSGVKFYINAVPVLYTVANIGTYTGMSNTAANLFIGKSEFIAGQLNASISYIAIFNKELNQAEVTNVNDKTNAGTHLI